MRTSLKIFLITVLACAITTCKKQKGYPADTNTGANVFGCYVDGQLFIPCASFQWRVKSVVQGDLNNFPFLTISAQNRCDRKYIYGRGFILYIDSVNLVENQTYKLGNYYNYKRGTPQLLYYEDLNYFGSDTSLPGTITIRKFDPVHKILSANFNAVVRSADSTQTKALTRGTFDVTFW